MATSHEGPITRQNPIVEAGVMVGCEMQMQQRIKSYLDSLKDLTGGLAFFFNYQPQIKYSLLYTAAEIYQNMCFY